MKNNRTKISTQLYTHNLLLVLTAVLLTGSISLYLALHIRQTDLDTSIRDVAAMVADLDNVKELLKTGQPDEALQQQLDLLTASLKQVDIVVICDTDSIRYYHNDKSRIGESFKGDDQADILNGSVPYISESEGTLGMQRRAFHAVYDEDGTLIGFVVASVLISSLTQIRRQLITIYLVIFLMLILAGCVLAWISTHRIRKLLLGYQPEEFCKLYVERTEVINALEEGICAVNADGAIILINQAARKILEIPSESSIEGTPVKMMDAKSRLLHTLQTGAAEYNVNEVIKDQNILSTIIPVYHQEQLIGAVSISRNKTELIKLAEELTGARYMIDTLRAVNHEFKNKLHIILGLLEMNETEKVKDYIVNASLASSEAVSSFSRLIPHSNLAALLIGKYIRASELGIQFSLKADSYFSPKEKELPVDCYITLAGNLIENAMDELNSSDYPVKEIELGIYSENEHTIITCDDTGGGIPEEILFSIYDRHTTTKGDGHGTGYALIKEIIDCYEGTIHIDTEKGTGTSVEIILPI